MNKKIFSLFLFLLLLFFMPFFYHFTFSKYILDFTFTSAKIQIDKKPKIEIVSVSNNNIGYENYANKTHEIILTVKVTENHITVNQLSSNKIQFLLDNKEIYPTKETQIISASSPTLVYHISISELTGNGHLSVVFPEGIIQDSANQKSNFLKFDTGILIDNISPQTTCEEISIEDSQSKYIINSNEYIRPLDGWEISQNAISLSKPFRSPVSYSIPITDYAGNITQTPVNIQQAHNLMLCYANYAGNAVTQFRYNGEISEKQYIMDNSNSKSEMIFTYLDGNVKPDTLQARIFDYTYWGPDTKAICQYSEIFYQYGYSPSPTSWYDMTTTNVINALKKTCLQLGGQGHNSANRSCHGSYNPIPPEIATQNLYGISGISFRLNHLEDYSIVYQIYVPNVGWLKSASDGEESTYSHDKPFTAMRATLVPKSEKQYVIKDWNRVIYTNYVG